MAVTGCAFSLLGERNDESAIAGCHTYVVVYLDHTGSVLVKLCLATHS